MRDEHLRGDDAERAADAEREQADADRLGDDHRRRSASTGQPTARRMPISRVRSNTDIAIVFVTPIPPTISARIETIQPVEMISRLEVSTLIAWPGSVIAAMPGERCLQPLGDRLHVLAELHVDADRRDLAGALRERSTACERQHDAEVLEAVARVVDPRDPEPMPAEPHDLADVLARVVAGHRLAAPALGDDEAAVGELGRIEAEDEQAVDDSSFTFATAATPGSRATFAASDSGSSERVKSVTSDW